MRLFSISVLGMAAVSIASAGQIEIGGCSAGSITSATNSCGLTAAYVGSGATGAGDWTTVGGGEKTYSSTLFSADTITNSSLNGVAETTMAGTGGTSTLPTSQNGFQQFTDPNTGVVFSMIADSASTTANFWASSSAATPADSASSITIPVGVMSVTSANVLLNDYYADGNTDTVTFNFANYGNYAVTLTDGNQIQAATDCKIASPYDTTQPFCTQYATSASSSNTDKAWTANYSNTNTAPTSPFSSTALAANPGTLALDDLAFSFLGVGGLNPLTDTLKSITITDNENCAPSEAGCTGANAINSRLALSAITVETPGAPTPEPSTVALFVGGLGVLGFFGKRRKVRS